MKIVKKIVEMHRLKKNIFLFCVYKMVEITKETWKKWCRSKSLMAKSG